MRGVILCGGLGTRLHPLTVVTNKHLLPVYDKPMVYYPIQTLIKAGIKEIMIIVSGEYGGNFIKLLKNGEDFGLKNLTYAYQTGNGGIAEALSLAKDFAGGDDLLVILGDNTTDAQIHKSVKNFKGGAHIFIKKVDDPKRYGICKFIENNFNRKLEKIVEKPIEPPSNLAVTGIYIFDNKVFDYIKLCKPSSRDQLEIADVLNYYIVDGKCNYSYLSGFWADAGEPDSLYLANKYWYNKNQSIK